MTTTQTPVATKVTYRKTKSGEWVAFGPTSVVRTGAAITVTKANGSTKSETIASVGKSFTANGVECCYGYLAEKAPRYSPRGYGRRTEEDHEDCLSFGSCGPNCDYNFARR